MAIKLTTSALFLIYFGSLKCTNEFELEFPIRVEYKCDPGFEVYKDKCYILMDDHRDFEGSKTGCPPEAGIASIHDAEINQFLMYMGKGSILLGLKYETDNYKWIDGTECNFKNFPSDYNEPFIRPYIGECVMMEENGDWINKDCSESDLPYVCQKNAIEKPTQEPPTSPPNMCPSDPWQAGGGQIYSPGYPAHYKGDSIPLNCSYIFAANPSPLTLSFTELSNYGTGYSVIYVYEGSSEKGTRIGNLTGDFYRLPQVITSSKTTMFMRFVSNVEGKWSAVWGPSASVTTTTTTTTTTTGTETTTTTTTEPTTTTTTEPTTTTTTEPTTTTTTIV